MGKAAALPLQGLDVGTYVLTVTVRDLVRGSTASARRVLAILSDDEIAAAADRRPRGDARR